MRRFGISPYLPFCACHPNQSLNVRWSSQANEPISAYSETFVRISFRSYITMRLTLAPVVTQLHRSYFIQAISDPHTFTHTHPHICSVLATYQNACQIIACLALVMRSDPEACRRIPCLWTQTFTAAVGRMPLESEYEAHPQIKGRSLLHRF